MAKDHGPSVKDDKQYEGLRKKGMSKYRAAAISNSPGSSSRGVKQSGSGGGNSQSRESSGSGSGGNKAQKAPADRKGGKKSSSQPSVGFSRAKPETAMARSVWTKRSKTGHEPQAASDLMAALDWALEESRRNGRCRSAC